MEYEQIDAQSNVHGEYGFEYVQVVPVTAFKTTFFSISSNGTATPIPASEISNPTPTFSNVSIGVGNLRLNSDQTRILADLAITGDLDDDSLDLIAGSAGVINGVSLSINGELFASLLTSVTKASGVSTLKPYDFAATFASTIGGVELQPGVNLFRLTAENAYGLAGFAEQAIEVLVEAPAPQPYEYEVRITEDPYANSTIGVTIEFRSRAADDNWGSWRALMRADFDTFADSNPALGARIDFVLDQPLDGTGDETSIWATLTDLATENFGEVIQFVLDRLEMIDGIEKVVWKGLWTREDHDLPDLSRHTIVLGASSPLVASSGGEFHPVLLGLDGLADLGNHIDQVTVGDSVYDLVVLGDDLMFALPGEELPRPFLTTANFSALESTPPTPTEQPSWMRHYDDQADGGAGDFALGIGAGLLWTIPDNLIGLWDGTKYVVRQGWNYIPPRMIYRWITTGDPRTVEDQRNFETAKGVTLKLASVLLKMQQDRDAFLYALWTGDDETANAIGEEYRVALELAAEMLDTLSEEVDALPAYEQGKIYGRIIGEVVVTVAGTFATAGGALAAKGATMAGVATRLKHVVFLQRFSAKFDDLIIFYNKVDDLVRAVESGVGEEQVIASRIASIVAYRQHRTGEGSWQALESLLSATADPRRRAVIDSHLLFATNIAMRGAYKEAADILRNGGTLAQAMQKVPTISRVNQVMAGRRAAAFLESHHTATKDWARRLIPGITDAELESMPALVLDKAWHRQFNDSGLPREYVFHNILKDKMRDVDPRNKADVLSRLRVAYRDFEGLDDVDPDPDVWVVTRAWLDARIQP